MAQHQPSKHRIVGKFHGVQIFAVFADQTATVKKNNTKNRNPRTRIWSEWQMARKLKPQKFLLEGPEAKICTSEISCYTVSTCNNQYFSPACTPSSL